MSVGTVSLFRPETTEVGTRASVPVLLMVASNANIIDPLTSWHLPSTRTIKYDISPDRTLLRPLVLAHVFRKQEKNPHYSTLSRALWSFSFPVRGAATENQHGN